MRFASDESGGFDLAKPGFELSLWSTVVCPPSLAPILTARVREWCEQWDIDELHAIDMDSDQRLEVAAWIGAQDILWVATVIDSEIMTAADAQQWRSDQVAEFDRSYAASRARGSIHPRYVGRGDQIRKLLNDTRAVRLPQFVQFGVVAPRHIADCVQAAIYRYREPRWQPDWAQSRLIFDKKDLKPEGGQRLITEVLFPILAASEMTLNLPVDYQDPNHPLIQLRARSAGGLNLLDLFGGDPVFDDSKSEPVVQLADVAGWLLRRAITHPNEPETEAAFWLLRMRLYRPQEGVLPFKLFFRRGRQLTRADLPRYEHLMD